MRWRLQRSMQYGRAIEEAVINCLGKVGLLSTGHGLGTFAEIKRMRCFRLRCTHGQVLWFNSSSLFVVYPWTMTWPGIVFQCFFLICGLHSVATLPLFYYSPVIFDVVHGMLLPFHVATLIV